MCGRFTLARPPSAIAVEFDLRDALELAPRYNVAPTQQVLTVRLGEEGRFASTLRWGLVPSWSGSLAGSAPLINARADGVSEKPAFRSAFKKRRCLVPADGFFEWQTVGRKKLPFLFAPADGSLLALAGLWEIWEREGQRVESFCLITTEANEVVSPTHDRMPVVVPREARDLWLDPAAEPHALKALLRPYPAEAMTGRPVSPMLNNARNEGPELLDGPGPLQAMMF